MRTPLFAFLVVATLAGCGGGSNAVNLPGPLPVARTVTIQWPERTRDIAAPASAQSAVVRFSAQGSTGVVQPTIVNRPAGAAASTAVVALGERASGTYVLNVEFRSGADGSGSVVATAASPVTLGASGNVGTIAVTSKIQTVTATVPDSILIGERGTVTVTALDAQGAIVAVAPQSVGITKTSGDGVFTVAEDGSFEATSAGTGTFLATIDGMSSGTQSLRVGGLIDGGFETTEVPNGGFVPTAVGWEVTPGAGVARGSGSWGTVAAEGQQYAYVQSNGVEGDNRGSLTTTPILLNPSENYSLRLSIARRNGNVGGNDGTPITVTVGGRVLLLETSPNDDGSYLTITTSPFRGDEGAIKIAASTTVSGDRSTLVDAVTVVRPLVPTPEG